MSPNDKPPSKVSVDFSKQEIIDWILDLMARHNLTPADIEQPENQQEPDIVSEH